MGSSHPVSGAVTGAARSPAAAGRRPGDAAASILRVASYNVHACVGRDGCCDADRVAAVIRELDADVVALQEVLSDDAADGPDQFAHLADALGLHAVEGPTLHRAGARYGNALLTRLPVLDVDRLDLSVTRRESRGAVAVDLGWNDLRVRVVATHLGLVRSERRRQVALLLDWLDDPTARQPAALQVLAGDINEWIPYAGTLRSLDGRFGRAPTVRSFPAHRPLLRLDRIWVEPLHALRRLDAHRSPLARRASDHLPVLAELDGATLAHDAPEALQDAAAGPPRRGAPSGRPGHGDCTS